MKAYLTHVGIFVVVVAFPAYAQSMLDADAKRAAARQRAFDRGFITKQKVEETKSNYMETMLPQNRMEAPPSSQIYSQVVQAGEYHNKKGMTNANATHNADPALYERSLEEAKKLYPELLNPSSMFSQRCAFLQRWAAAASLPLSTDARRPLLLAHIAALELHGAKKQDSQELAPPPPPEMTPTELVEHANKANARFLPGPALRGVSYLEITGSTAIGPDGSTYIVRKHITGNGFYIENGSERIHIPASGTRTTWPNGLNADFRRVGNRIEFVSP